MNANGTCNKQVRLMREMRGGEPYAYYPLGRYIVAAPGVCGGRPTFKGTRIEVRFILDLIAAGWTIERVVTEYQRPELTRAAIREVIALAKRDFVSASSVANLVV